MSYYHDQALMYARHAPYKKVASDGAVLWRRPLWSFRSPSEKTKLVLERFSKGKSIHRDDLEKLVRRLADKFSAFPGNDVVYRSVLGVEQRIIGLANGKWIMAGAFKYLPIRPFTLASKFFIEIKQTSVPLCFWCKRPCINYDPMGRHNHYKFEISAEYGTFHCGGVGCRELDAVLHKKHNTIKVSFPKKVEREVNREAALAHFVALVIKEKLRVQMKAQKTLTKQRSLGNETVPNCN